MAKTERDTLGRVEPLIIAISKPLKNPFVFVRRSNFLQRHIGRMLLIISIISLLVIHLEEELSNAGGGYGDGFVESKRKDGHSST